MTNLSNINTDNLLNLSIEEANKSIIKVLTYIIHKAEISNKKTFFDFIEQTLTSSLRKQVITLTDQLKSEGFNQGVHHGLQQGKIAGAHNLFINQLKNKFGPLTKADLQKVYLADDHDLIQWSKKVSFAYRLEEVFN